MSLKIIMKNFYTQICWRSRLLLTIIVSQWLQKRRTSTHAWIVSVASIN